MIRRTIVPAIPDIRDDNLKEVMRAIKATIDVREGSIGDPLDQAVTLRDLTDLNLAMGGGVTSTLAGGSLPVSAMLPPVTSGYNPSTDFTPPPAPSGLRARGGFTNVYLEWDGAPYRNHGYTEIWRSNVDALAQASFVGTTAASLYADAAAPDTTYFYWIRFVSSANVTGPYNQTSGTRAATALDVSSALTALSSELQSSQLFVDLGTRIRTIETDAFIQNVTSGAYKSQLDQLSAGVTSANSQITSLRAVNATQATQLTELSTTAGVKTRTFFQATAPASTLTYKLTPGDTWIDTDDNNKSYRWDGLIWVVFAAGAKVYYQASPPADTAATPLLPGDLWYDADDQNKPYRWSGSTWVELRDGFINARVTTLEQTKIGYATLNSTGLVFDNNGAITDKATTDAWNAANPGNLATWRVGLPLATAVKQVGVTDGASTLTLEQRFTAQKQTNSDLYGQYTVKIDNNGHVTGFGLASGTVNGAPTSAFIVRADRFGIAGVNDADDPLGTLAPTRKPFIVLTAGTTINGKVYPAGTWIDTAFIANATITNAQITDLTADKLTAGAVSAAMGLTTGKLWGGVAVSTNKDNGTFGNLLYPFASTNFGTGFFLGNDGGAYKFYVGKPDQNMNWNGSALTVTGTLNAVAGNFRNITVYDSLDRVILSSGGVPFSAVNGLGSIAALNEVPWTSVASRPTTLAALDATAAADLDGRTLTYYQNSAPAGTVNDLWFDTDDGNKLYRHNGSSWVAVQDAGIAAAAGLASQAQTTANGKITTYYSIAAPTSPVVGDLWYSTDTREIKRWSGSAWVVSGNYVNNTNQITDGAGLGTTATWANVANRPTTLAALDATAATDLDGKTVTYYQASAPIGTVNDLWFDTDDGNKLYRHNGSGWVAVQDAGIAAAAGLASQAQTTANGKITTYYATSAPTATAIGDLWYNSSTRELKRWSGSAWVTSGNYVDNTNQITDGAGLGTTATWANVANRPTTLAALDAIAAADLDGRTLTYYQASAPAGTVNDLWFDTDDGNKLYRHNGSSWVLVQDAGIAAAAGLASQAQTTANGKVTTFYSATQPVATAIGDLWYNTSSRELLRWSGSAWATSATRNTVYRQSTAPAGASVNDVWFNTATAAVSYWNGSSWVLAGDVTSANTAAGIAGQGALATQNSVFVGSTVKFADGSTMNTSDFVNKLTKIGTGNIGSFITDAAIGDAYIGNLNASKITAGTIAADRLDATVISAKVANLNAAVITSGTINNAVIGDLSAKRIYTGNATSAVTFVDPSAVGISLRSQATGYLSYTGDTGASQLIVETCYDAKYGTPYDCSYYVYSGAPVTSSLVKFTCGSTSGPTARRVRTGTVRFTVMAFGTVDHYFSIWFRLGGGAWGHIATAIEPQSSYGSVGVVAALEINMVSGVDIEFGMAATDGAGQYWNSSRREIRYGHLVVTGTNF